MVQKQGFKLGKQCSLRLKQLGFNRFAGFASCFIVLELQLSEAHLHVCVHSDRHFIAHVK